MVTERLNRSDQLPENQNPARENNGQDRSILSKREAEILQLCARGMGTKEIAEALQIKE